MTECIVRPCSICHDRPKSVGCIRCITCVSSESCHVCGGVGRFDDIECPTCNGSGLRPVALREDHHDPLDRERQLETLRGDDLW